jgi:hypothetical protein
MFRVIFLFLVKYDHFVTVVEISHYFWPNLEGRGFLQIKIKVPVTEGPTVGDPDPALNPHVFGPPGSEPVSQRYGSGSFPFLIKVLSGLK